MCGTATHCTEAMLEAPGMHSDAIKLANTARIWFSKGEIYEKDKQHLRTWCKDSHDPPREPARKIARKISRWNTGGIYFSANLGLVIQEFAP
jgi:hypothetical protein